LVTSNVEQINNWTNVSCKNRFVKCVINKKLLGGKKGERLSDLHLIFQKRKSDKGIKKLFTTWVEIAPGITLRMKNSLFTGEDLCLKDALC